VTLEYIFRLTFHLGISILDRYLYYRKDDIPQSHLQTIGTSCLFIAAKLEEVTPPDLHRLVEFGDGAVVADDLIKIVSCT
jgi:cyclin E